MSKSVESTRRELFEQLVSIPDSVTWSDETNSYIGQNFWLVDYAWEAFNAALDAVEIDLEPAIRTVGGGPIDGSMYTPEVYKAIESLNLGIKIRT